MSNTQSVGIIRPEIVAAKLAAVRDYKHPEILKEIQAEARLVEVLWFIQFMSMQPGGLEKFCADMVQALPQRFGTQTLRETKSANPRTKLAIWSEIPRRYLPEEAPPWQHAGDGDTADLAHLWVGRVMADNYDPDARAAEKKAQREAVAEYLQPVTIESLRECCYRAAREMLPAYLSALCNNQDRPFRPQRKSYMPDPTWFMDDPLAAVVEMMDIRRTEVSKSLAMTAVATKVFDALDYALEEKAMVRIEGDSRFGKTESVRAWCGMRPGLARVVNVPCSNSVSDLHRRIAEALGMDVSYGSRTTRLRERIEYVLQHSGLFLVLDEGAFLVPQNYSESTAPARLNWVRTEIVDRGLPLAVVVTPQNFAPAVARFIKKTGYAMEQFFGRNFLTVRLPAELDEEDLVAVARIHFPELGDDYLAVTADFARMSENYLQTVEAIAKRARFIARRQSHRRVTVADIEAAASEIIPRRNTAPGSSPEVDDSTAPKSRIKGPLKGAERGIRPARTQEAFQECSLRGAGPVRLEAELVSAES